MAGPFPFRLPGLALLLGLGLVVPLPQAAADTLAQSMQRLKDFPFTANCEGNTQEMVACLWQQRNQADLRLRQRLGSDRLLEAWRRNRADVCDVAAQPMANGSIVPLVTLGCENALNATLRKQLQPPRSSQ